MAWPSRPEVWNGQLEQAASDYVALAEALAEDSQVTVICNEDDFLRVRSRVKPAVTMYAMPIDDGWLRDNGPFTVEQDGAIRLVNFDFNSWGNRFSPSARDAGVSSLIAEELRMECEEVALVLEGGAISVNGAGTALAVEESLLNVNRIGPLAKADVEAILLVALGIERVIWLPFGLLEDLPNTDGHVDNVARFVSENTVLAQLVPPDDPNYQRLVVNRAVLETSVTANGDPINIQTIHWLPRTEMPDGTLQPSPYLNFVSTKGTVVFPSVDEQMDLSALHSLRAIAGKRDVKLTPSRGLTYGGGGPHCVTLPIWRR